MLLKNKKILLGITGSIAAYKSILLIRLLIKEGAELRVVMTPSAKDFVSPLTISVLSKNKVSIEWQESYEWNNHVELGRWADLFVIAPLSCNTLSKMATGGCDNLLMAVYLSATCPVCVAPAMDEDMWKHATTQKNLATIAEQHVNIVPVNNGELASGLVGEGRMAEPEEIVHYIIANYFRSNILAGKKLLITAGPTYEPIDPVRFIGNRSSGKMGYALAEAFYLQGADVVLVSGPSNQSLLFQGIKLVKVNTADEMFEACMQNGEADIVVMSAAVADYKPEKPATQKIKKAGESLDIHLIKNKDILKHFGENKKQGQILIGFALETENEQANALQKLLNKRLDCIILNSLNQQGAGFEKDTNQVTVIDANETTAFSLQTKKELAVNIVQHLIQKYL
jgi:phosphopantothenoylcysteine decarboxylase / phosphopantothenate---cysteine ligase